MMKKKYTKSRSPQSRRKSPRYEKGKGKGKRRKGGFKRDRKNLIPAYPPWK
jgi:hypothetical protein